MNAGPRQRSHSPARVQVTDNHILLSQICYSPKSGGSCSCPENVGTMFRIIIPSLSVTFHSFPIILQCHSLDPLQSASTYADEYKELASSAW
jgi:hypothetical protein